MNTSYGSRQGRCYPSDCRLICVTCLILNVTAVTRYVSILEGRGERGGEGRGGEGGRERGGREGGRGQSEVANQTANFTYANITSSNVEQ